MPGLAAAETWLVFTVDLRLRAPISHMAFLTAVHTRHVLHAAWRGARPIVRVTPLAWRTPLPKPLLKPTAHNGENSGLRIRVGAGLTHLAQEVVLLSDPLYLLLLFFVDLRAR